MSIFLLPLSSTVAIGLIKQLKPGSGTAEPSLSALGFKRALHWRIVHPWILAAASSTKRQLLQAEVRQIGVADSAVAKIEFVYQILAIEGIDLHTT